MGVVNCTRDLKSDWVWFNKCLKRILTRAQKPSNIVGWDPIGKSSWVFGPLGPFHQFFSCKKNKLRWTVPKTCLDPPNRTSPSEKWRFRSARLNDHGPIMGFQRCPLPRHPFPKNEQGFAPSLSFTWFFKRKIKKNKSFSTKIKESHHLSHLGEGCVTLLLPYCYLILLGFPFFHKTVKTPRPLGSASERRTREDLKRAGGFHGGFHGGRRIFWRCPRVNPGNFRELPIFRPTFHGQVGGFEKSADSEAFGGDLGTFGYLWIREIPVQEADITKTIQTIRKCTGYSKQIDQNVPKINLI